MFNAQVNLVILLSIILLWHAKLDGSDCPRMTLMGADEEKG